MVGGEQGGVWDVFENSIPQGEEVHVLVQQLGGVRKLFAVVLLDLIDECRQVLLHELLDFLGELDLEEGRWRFDGADHANLVLS